MKKNPQSHLTFNFWNFKHALQRERERRKNKYIDSFNDFSPSIYISARQEEKKETMNELTSIWKMVLGCVVDHGIQKVEQAKLLLILGNVPKINIYIYINIVVGIPSWNTRMFN